MKQPRTLLKLGVLFILVAANLIIYGARVAKNEWIERKRRAAELAEKTASEAEAARRRAAEIEREEAKQRWMTEGGDIGWALAEESIQLRGVDLIWCAASEVSDTDSSKTGDLESQTYSGFWVARRECTKSQWAGLMGDRKMKIGWISFAEEPMSGLSWNDAISFVDEMNISQPAPPNWRWSLPTETQWELAVHSIGETNAPSMLDEIGEWCATFFSRASVGEAITLESLETVLLVFRKGDQREGASPDYVDDQVGFRLVLVRNDEPDTGRLVKEGLIGIELAKDAKRRKEKEMAKQTEKSAVATERKNLERVWAAKGHRLESLRAGDAIKFAGFEFAWCPAGEFTMGSPPGDGGRHHGGEDQHHVTLTSGFWMATTECTQAQWERFMGNNPSSDRHLNPDFPVDNVSWKKVQEFLQIMNTDFPPPSGWEWNLPTEAQWEYACRAGTNGPFAGPNLEDLGWSYNSKAGRKAARKKASNPWGLYDMHGNVSEWCANWYYRYPSGRLTDPQGPDASESYATLRGGSWRGDAKMARGGSNLDYPVDCRSASREGHSPDYRSEYLGFRPALVRVR